jgi:hypothetical protein
MTVRRNRAIIPGLAAIAAAAIALSAYSGGSSRQGFQPAQPINFPHPAHVVKTGMNCVYCHFAAYKSPDPGVPAVGTCMGCHQFVMASSPEVQKIHEYSNSKKPIPWVRIHSVPDYVQFPHMRHVNAGVSCQTCHSNVQEMDRVYQAESLNMGWCVSCHIENKVRYDCAVCHY